VAEAPRVVPLTDEVARVLEAPEERIEGRLKVTGQAVYTADLVLPGMLHAEFLHSPVPYARIVSIDASAALALPGVRAVLTGQDIGPVRFGRQLMDWPVLAFERVLYIGERVAAVAADTAEIAEQAVQLIQVEYEELPAVYDPEAALEPGVPVLHPRAEEYRYAGGQRPPVPHPNLQGYDLSCKGDPDIERAFAQAAHVFEDVYTAPRQHQGYLEPHACVVWIDPDGIVHVRTTNKAPFQLRSILSIVSGVPQDRIIVDSRFIGGDFGGKGHSLEDYATYFLARATGRPVKAVMSYTDELLSADPRHSARFYLRTGVTADGRIVAHQTRAYFNGGAYGGAKPMAGLLLPGWDALEVYSIPNTRLETFVVYTNTVPSGNMRAPGAAQLALAGEGHIEHIARSLGMDPLAFRLKNALREGDTSPANHHVRNPRAVEVLDALQREARWGEGARLPYRGRGMALRSRHVGTGRTNMVLRLLPDGTLEALYGTPDQGSGSATMVRRLISALLSVPQGQIIVRYGTTAEAPWDAGAGASRCTHIVGRVAMDAGIRLKEQLLELAAEVMGWPAGDVRLEDGAFVVSNGAERASFVEVARRIARAGTIEARSSYDSSTEHPEDFNFHAYMVEVEVDPETGKVSPIEAITVVDVGPIINPIAHQGQIDGSFVYGLGNGLMEELRVEEGRITTLSLGEYKMPCQMDVVPLRTVLVPTEIGPGPFGAKAAGESVNAGVTPAIANAIYDAVGVRIKDMPITAERVLAALRERQQQR
jgi:carbon-monoxide dehydrogenase large subunit